MNTADDFPERPPGNETELGECSVLEATLLEGIDSSYREYGEHVLDEIRKAVG